MKNLRIGHDGASVLRDLQKLTNVRQQGLRFPEVEGSAGTEGKRGDLNELVATLLDAVAQHMGLGKGTASVEFEFEQGRMRRYWVKARGGRGDLDRFAGAET
jgi:hypothetical protein